MGCKVKHQRLRNKKINCYALERDRNWGVGNKQRGEKSGRRERMKEPYGGGAEENQRTACRVVL